MTKIKEIWKDVVGWESSYEVSNIGNVRSKARFVDNKYPNSKSLRQSKLLGQRLTVWGYTHVALSRNSKNKSLVVHRIVAKAFIPNPENKPCVNHKNGIKTDNSVENLEWCTHKENTHHAFSTGLSKGPVGGNNRSARIVLNLNTGIFYDTIKQAAESIPTKDYTLFARMEDFGFVRV